MIRIGQLKLQPNHTEKELVQKIAKTLRISESEIRSFKIQKQSVDARKKPDLKYVYTVDIELSNEGQILKKQKGNTVSIVKEKPYQFETSGTQPMKARPIIIGSGPAGLFCAYILAGHGYRPIVFERGASVDERTKDIDMFWKKGKLNPESNVQFGEGGAGTFSDGKLNTLVKDAFGRNKKVLEIFVENGAPEEILYINKPHIGTDILIDVVRNMRDRIIKWGGEVYFHSKFIDFSLNNGSLESITIETSEGIDIIPAETLVLAIGHSARDTFSMLYEKQLPMTAKSFAVGVRVEHRQQVMNDVQYGENCPYKMPAAPYKVTANLENGRGVYSFCMCPGGYVVNASSEEGHLAVNGMSYHARDGKNANSAIIVTVTPEDFGSEHPLAGVEFQRKLEKAAYEIGGGKVPVQCYGDYCKNEVTKTLGEVEPQIKGGYIFANVRQIFPKEIGDSIELGIKSFDKQIHGFAKEDTVLAGVESRTSSPVRITRNELLQIENTGIYPCGEGAGYAGGITSAAMDGLKTAEMIAKKFVAFDER
ncbi:MAG: NAD(P)-binding protein [Tyzzerella sp.]|nr:NAD(P)-binding protein [Tyzzerella sp.]